MNDIASMYQHGYSSCKISEKYKVCHKQINKILDSFNITRKHNGIRKWNIN